jgi:GNAT superfamily N-acetyltransferase
MSYFLRHTTGTDPDFHTLVAALDRDLWLRYGAEQAFFAQFNYLDDIHDVVVVYHGEMPVACGAFKAFDATRVEIKRMYVAPEHRGQQLGARILEALEQRALEKGYAATVLETGVHQPEAIRLYEKTGYLRIPNYGPYIGVEASWCFEKVL